MQSLYLDQVLGLLGKPIGLAMLAGLLFLLVASMQVKFLRWVMLAIVMFTASLGKEVRPERVGEFAPRLISPLQEIQDLGRPITAVLLLTALVMILFTDEGLRGRRISGAILCLALVQAVLIVKMLTSGMVFYAVFSAFTYVLWLLVFGFGLSRWLQGPADILWALRAVCLASTFFCAANLVQAAIDPAPLLVGPRFTGTTANPQFAAALLSLATPAAAYLIAQRRLHMFERYAWGLLCVVQASLIIWTGSRTGALMALMSVCLVFRRQLGQLIFFGVLLAVAIAWIASAYSDYVNVEYLTRTADTRSENWSGQWVNFLDYPVFGSPQDPRFGRLGFAENSWLSMAGNCGVIGLLPLLAFGIALALLMIQMAKQPSKHTQTAQLADVIIASIIVFLFGSVFEAYLLGVVNFPLPFLFVILALAQHARSKTGPMIAKSGTLRRPVPLALAPRFK